MEAVRSDEVSWFSNEDLFTLLQVFAVISPAHLVPVQEEIEKKPQKILDTSKEVSYF